MSGLAGVRYPPPTPNGFKEWAFVHYQHHRAIIDAAAQSGKGKLTLYLIYPINENDLGSWSEQHQQQHSDMDALYGIAGADMSEIDFNDKRALDAFYYQNFLEHLQVAHATGLPI